MVNDGRLLLPSQRQQPPQTHRDDVLLVRAVLTGDADSRTRLLGRLACIENFLFGIVQRRHAFLPNDEVLEVVQDTLVRVWFKLREYRGASKLETWVYRFCYLELLNHLRRRARRPMPTAHLLDALPAASFTPRDRSELGTYLRMLSAREADVVYLRHVESATVDQSAQALGISTSSVKTLYHRALDKLRQNFSDPLPS